MNHPSSFHKCVTTARIQLPPNVWDWPSCPYCLSKTHPLAIRYGSKLLYLEMMFACKPPCMHLCICSFATRQNPSGAGKLPKFCWWSSAHQGLPSPSPLPWRSRGGSHRWWCRCSVRGAWRRGAMGHCRGHWWNQWTGDHMEGTCVYVFLASWGLESHSILGLQAYTY